MRARSGAIGDRTFWNDRRLFRLGLSVLLGIIVAIVVTYLTDYENRSFIKSGDFPGFYAPAVIIGAGGADKLYDAATQREVENRFWPVFGGKYYMSVYPPYVAAALSPLAALPAQDARDVFTVCSFLLFLMAFFKVRDFSRLMRANLLFSLAAIIAFGPVFYGVLGGQNTALSMWIVVVSAACMYEAKRRDSPELEILTGMILGIWLFKPQFGALAGLFLLLSGHRRAFGGFLLVAVAWFSEGLSVTGVEGYLQWFTAIGRFSATNYLVNNHEQVSLIGCANSLCLYLGCGDRGGAVIIGLAGIMSMLIALVVVKALKSARRVASFHGRQRAVLDSLLLMGSAMPLISPQALFYDLGISVMCAAGYIRLESDRSSSWLLCAIVAAGFATYYREFFPVSPLLLVSACCFLFVLWRGRIGS